MSKQIELDLSEEALEEAYTAMRKYDVDWTSKPKYEGKEDWVCYGGGGGSSTTKVA